MALIEVNLLVIGAGAVGCAAARQCAITFPDKKIAVIEKHPAAGMEASSHNSGMIHSGVYEMPGSLKSQLCLRGNVLAKEFATQSGVPAKYDGMIIAVPANQPRLNIPAQLAILGRLMLRARRLGIPFKFIGSHNNYEPSVKIIAGMFMPNAFVVDAAQFTKKLQESAEDNGASFYFEDTATEIIKEDGRYRMTAGQHTFIARAVVNSAGLYADEIAAMAGFTGYKIYPWRGEYYEVVGASITVTRPISSVMPRHHGKGIQVLPSLDGKLLIGPNSYLANSKDDYDSRVTPPESFLESATKLLPGLTPDRLVWSSAGMRAKLNDSYQETDFIISKDSESPTFINLIGIESPGLSSCMAIAEVVAEKLQ